MIIATICKTCKGTILPEARAGSPRGTCTCQPRTGRQADYTEGWEPRGPQTTVCALDRHTVVQLTGETILRRIERKTTTGVKLVALHGNPDPRTVPAMMPATPFTYVRRRK